MKNLHQDITYPSQNLNQVPPKDKSEAALFEPICTSLKWIQTYDVLTNISMPEFFQ
jgi:hypothetical protein